MTGVGELDLRQLELQLVLGVDEHVARLDVLQLRDRADVALADLADGRVVLALHEHQRARPLLRVRARVDDVASRS